VVDINHPHMESVVVLVLDLMLLALLSAVLIPTVMEALIVVNSLNSINKVYKRIFQIISKIITAIPLKRQL
jgi:hypothetical protein